MQHVQGVYALVLETLKHGAELDFIAEKSKIFEENPRLYKWLGRVFITALLLKNHTLTVEAKPLQTVLDYKNKLYSAFEECSKLPDIFEKKQGN